jgi:hypothetical protein
MNASFTNMRGLWGTNARGMRLACFVVERVPGLAGHESNSESKYRRLIDLHATVHQLVY